MAIESMAMEAPSEEAVVTGVLHDIYIEQVREIYPRGARFRCAKSHCDHTVELSVHQLADVTSVGGWPRHCGKDMVISDPIAEEGLE